MNKLLPDTIQWGRELSTIEHLIEGIPNENTKQLETKFEHHRVTNACIMPPTDIRVSFSDGSKVDCALVIGADGIRSKTR